jgi:hypothetical protein
MHCIGLAVRAWREGGIMTFKVQIDSDKYEQALTLLLVTHAQLTMLSIMYGNDMSALVPSNEILLLIR